MKLKDLIEALAGEIELAQVELQDSLRELAGGDNSDAAFVGVNLSIGPVTIG